MSRFHRKNRRFAVSVKEDEEREEEEEQKEEEQKEEEQKEEEEKKKEEKKKSPPIRPTALHEYARRKT